MYTTLAGNPDRWDAEIVAAAHDIADLKKQQQVIDRVFADQFYRGRRAAEVVRCENGWSVVNVTANGRAALFVSPGRDPGPAYAWGSTWAEADPDNRELFVKTEELERTHKEGYIYFKATAALRVCLAAAADEDAPPETRREARRAILKTLKQLAKKCRGGYTPPRLPRFGESDN